MSLARDGLQKEDVLVIFIISKVKNCDKIFMNDKLAKFKKKF